MISPGNTIGILGGGQLGRMLGQAAQTMGYRVHVFEPAGPCPAGAVANKEVNASYDDTAALTAFARECAVVTYEFENIPSGPLDAASRRPCIAASTIGGGTSSVAGSAFLNSIPEPRARLCTLHVASP